MCGIAGIVSLNSQLVNELVLKRMTRSIEHRGPDGEGSWISENEQVGLAHRRLSIIDLSIDAKQPMHYLNRYTITFNGEIYNYIELKDNLIKDGYKFISSSDTEVLLALYDKYKEKCLQYLDGMFAFVIYDQLENQIFCARDRFGEKPFHYYYDEGKTFIFASEMKAIWAAGIERNVNSQMLFNYIQFGLTHNPNALRETFFDQIKRLEHAHYLVISLNDFRLKIKPYWTIDEKKIKNGISFENACANLNELFYTSVKRRLRSDVPVGSSLSGGLDSSLVVCVINELNKNNAIRQKTFSAQFPGFEKDESYYQNLVIDNTKPDPYFTQPGYQNLIDEIDKIFYHQEEPFNSASLVAQYEVFKLAKQQNVTVLLDGQGADEFLAGYHPYFQYFFLEQESDKLKFQQQWLAYKKMHENNSINPLLKKGIKYQLKSKLPTLFHLLKKANRTFIKNNTGFNDDFFHSNKAMVGNLQPLMFTLNDALKHSTLGGGLQELLRYADRNSMAHSREVRLPFLNHELVEYVFSLPSEYKINNGWTKFIMRKTFEDILPNEITWRKDKIGYEPPQKKWMETEEMKEIIFECKTQLVKKGVMNKSILKKALKPGTALEKGDNSWAYIMSGKLLSK